MDIKVDPSVINKAVSEVMVKVLLYDPEMLKGMRSIARAAIKEAATAMVMGVILGCPKVGGYISNEEVVAAWNEARVIVSEDPPISEPKEEV